MDLMKLKALAQAASTNIGKTVAQTEADVHALVAACRHRTVVELIALVERQEAELKADKNVIMAMADDLGAIHDELGLDPEDAGGAEPIIEEIQRLAAARAPAAVVQMDALTDERRALLRLAERIEQAGEQPMVISTPAAASLRAIIAASQPAAPVQAAPMQTPGVDWPGDAIEALAHLESLATKVVGEVEAKHCAGLVRAGSEWAGAVNWLRNNYQDSVNIASLCDAMLAAATAQREAM